MSKSDLPDRELELELRHIKSLIENGNIKRMRDLKDSSSTKIANYSGINQGRYSSKLFTPGDFTESEICRIAYVIDVDPSLISKIIFKEISKEEFERVNSNIKKHKERK